MLITEEQAQSIPGLYAQEEVEDPKVFIQIRCMDAVWLVTEFDKEKRLAFGYAELYKGGGELGYISIEELEEMENRFPIFSEEVNKKLSEMKKELGLI